MSELIYLVTSAPGVSNLAHLFLSKSLDVSGKIPIFAEKLRRYEKETDQQPLF